MANTTTSPLTYGETVYFTFTNRCQATILKTSKDDIPYTPPTTTTLGPETPTNEDPQNPNCTGDCRFTWTEATFTWTEDSNTCATPTTAAPTDNRCKYTCVNFSSLGNIWFPDNSDCDDGYDCNIGSP